VKKGSLINLTSKGFRCDRGDFYIDPWKPVDRAVLTHAHSDHAYRGNREYLVAKEGEQLAGLRLDPGARISSQPYGASTSINGVKLSFHPAGHILGSSQIRLEYKGEVWVISGDYKLTSDPTCQPFEPLKCHVFISEATFGLPIYRWPPQQQVYQEMNDWWRRASDRGKSAVIFAYSLGKAQRILSGIDSSIGPIFTHGAVERLTQAYRDSGVELPPTTYAGNVTNKKEFQGGLVIGPPSAQGSTWLRRFGPSSTGFASGWMIVRGARRQRAVDRGFVLSDHADWPELETAIRATGAERVFVTHTFATELSQWLNENGIDAKPLATRFVGDDVAEMPDEERENAL
jgi:putative mRNA 3-end processing factor